MASGIRSSQPTTLTLVRHGECGTNVERCFGGHSDSPLSDLGHRQAARLAKHLKDSGATQLYCSDLRRAIQTATPIAESLGLPVVQDAGLRERGVGELDGKTFRYAQEERPELWEGLVGQDPDWRPPGGETVREAYERMDASLRKIVAAHPAGHIIVVTHAIAIHLGINGLLNVGSPGAMALYFPVKNASISSFVIGPKRVQVSGINLQEHLSAL